MNAGIKGVVFDWFVRSHPHYWFWLQIKSLHCVSADIWLPHDKSYIIGPLLDDGLKQVTLKALKGLPLSLLFCLSVCLCVCLLTRYRSQFLTLQPNFLKICSLGLWEKRFFSVFWNFHFWRFYGLFSLFSEFFPLCLCIGHKPPHSTYKHIFWHVGSLWHRKRKQTYFFNIFIFDDFIP